jgi:hypothetical protein
MNRGGGGNEVDGLMTFCHDARKGRNIGNHWPNHVRASALLDHSRAFPGFLAWTNQGLPFNIRKQKLLQASGGFYNGMSGIWDLSRHKSRRFHAP